MKRLLAVLLLLLMPAPALADWSVRNGSYTQTIRGTTIGGSVIQDINIVDSVTGNRATVVGGALTTSATFAGTVTLGASSAVIGHIICDSGCSSSSSPSFSGAFPSTGTPIGFTDGTNMVPGRIRTSTPGSGDNGLVVRPLMPSDGTNTMPAMDSPTRSGHVTIDNGSATTTENGNLTLGTSSVAETVSVTYGQAITTPSTMTLGTNGNGMRATYDLDGAAVVRADTPMTDRILCNAQILSTASAVDLTNCGALGASIFTDIRAFMITNFTSTNAAVQFSCGSNTYLVPVPSASSSGTVGGVVFAPPGGFWCSAVNTKWQVQSFDQTDAAASVTGKIEVRALAFKSKIQ